MTPKQQLNVRISAGTRAKLDQLCELYETTRTEVVALALDRLHVQEFGPLNCPECNAHAFVRIGRHPENGHPEWRCSSCHYRCYLLTSR